MGGIAQHEAPDVVQDDAPPRLLMRRKEGDRGQVPGQVGPVPHAADLDAGEGTFVPRWGWR